jgi:hypothetical protein
MSDAKGTNNERLITETIIGAMAVSGPALAQTHGMAGEAKSASSRAHRRAEHRLARCATPPEAGGHQAEGPFHCRKREAVAGSDEETIKSLVITFTRTDPSSSHPG